MLRTVLRHAGGIRIDHVLGLFRLWWIPPGRSAAEGTFVYYPAEEMLGVLALEATRAGAIVVGEDLGTVPPGVREALHRNGILGSAVLYFQRGDEGFLPPETWAPTSLATIDTHDLPTAAGYLTDQRVPLYRSLGLLDDEQAAAESRQAAIERKELVALMLQEAVIADGASVEELVVGMHALLGRSRCTLVLASLADAVFDRRQPNVPGTTDDQHPNWCLPIATDVDGVPVPILLDDLMQHPGVRRVVAALRGGRNDTLR
jgi:4-alpha-glucanotransferase